MQVRRVVTGVDAGGKSMVVSDGPAPRTHDYENIPGYRYTMVWATQGIPQTPNTGTDITSRVDAIFPHPGDTCMAIIEVPPVAVYRSASFDREAAAREQAVHAPGAAKFYEKNSSWHAAPTVDLMLMLDGEIWLLLDQGQPTCLRAGDVCIQNGTRHAWENRLERPARFLVVPIGGQPPAAR